jgi:alkylation response protein AidB-like acyl-CoA dehydrogenase/flavin-dependent dehydrogenase/ferredoxin-like protein FixX
MGAANFDVVVVGAGCAGLTAAIGLAKAGFSVAVVEAAAYPGAENWSGCVYFCENLVQPDILGPDGVEALAWERRLIERGAFATDGHSLLGMSYRDPAAFRHCYTVLRPIFDHHMGLVAIKHGVALLNETTAESLIRDGCRVVGVSTQRGPLYANLVFLAEGDASHLVTREGYERFTDPRDAPKFLQGIKQVIELPQGAIEQTFRVGPEEGVAYEMLVRNGTLRGRPVRLNMGGFVYANRQSLSIGLVLPADNLREHFGGDPNLLMEWFENLPALQPWLRDGKRGPFGAKIIRGGGARDIPRLIDAGLAIGGAASAIGVDFPYPNFTGPATAMGLLLVRAARRIRDEKTGFTPDALRRHYLEPLQRTHYWEDVEFLRRWPGYVKRTSVFFGRNLDLALGSAFVWTRPRRWFVSQGLNWLRLVWDVAAPAVWREWQTDLRHLSRALRFDEVLSRPGNGRLFLDGSVNALRDLFGSPRANLPEAGEIKLHYTVAGGAEPTGLPPALFHRWFRRFTPILASAARRVYSNNEEPLADKLFASSRLLMRQINLLDLMGAGLLALGAAIASGLLAGWDRLTGLFRRRGKVSRGVYPQYAIAVRRATDLTSAVSAAEQHWEGRLGQLAYQSVKSSHIHVLWPRSLPDKNKVVQQGLWHVCPAHVYEARVNPAGQVQVVVNFENCIKCETCWRTSDLVDWGRDGQHRFIYPVQSPVVARLLDAVPTAGAVRPPQPASTDWWEPAVRDLAERLRSERPSLGNGQAATEIADIESLLDKLERKLEEFDAALAEEPRTVDRARAEYLEMLARYAQQLALRIVEVLRGSTLANSPQPSVAAAHSKLLELASALATRAEERARRTWDQRYSWAAADGRQLRHHHIAGLRRFLLVVAKHLTGRVVPIDPARAWLQAEEDQRTTAEAAARLVARLDAVLPASAWRELERQMPLSTEQDATLRDLIAQVPPIDPNHLERTLHPPFRKVLLAELGRRDPSLAYRTAAHLWARDLARLASGSSALSRAFQRWARGDEWACFAAVDATQATHGGWQGEALFVPGQHASSFLLLLGDQLAVAPVQRAGIRVEPLATLGLRGAGMALLRLVEFKLPVEHANVDHDRILRAWRVLSSADLTSIAHGMADILCERAIAHATSRVQFPGLFHDEDARDPIGKFGAVKKMIAEMGARRYVIETLDHTLSPLDFSSPSVLHAGLAKIVVAEALGTAPGSLSYNAGQVFGGTGYSEDDILAKFYRDAAAWRFLGPTDVEVCRSHGEELLRGWRPDGQRLANLRGETELIDPLAQRKALQAELDEVRVVRSRLRGLVNEWLATFESASEAARAAFSARAQAEIGERLAMQDAHLLASKALLLRTHARLESGLASEVETSLLRVWLEGVVLSLEDFESVLRRHFSVAEQHEERPVVEPSAGAPITVYGDYLAAAAPYDSGDFLEQPVNLVQPRLVPEMRSSDPALVERDREFRDLIAAHFGAPRDGLIYERYIERHHRMADADLDYCRQHGFFRLMIPPDLGGAGRPKIDYYLLITNAQRLADIAVSLTIQVNTSIGTTPVLLARSKDLPKAQKELGPFVGDPALQSEIQKRLDELAAGFERAGPKRIEAAYKDLHQRLEESVFASPVLKTLTFRFVEAWTQAGRAGKAFDLPAMKARLEEARGAWRDACHRCAELHRELGRRREACDLFLKWVSSGQISAFALTEPSAGSDTARVATRAVLHSAPVLREADGVLHFVPTSGKEPRYLLDARRLDFRWDEVNGRREYRPYYRWSDSAEPALLHFDEYDYETDDPAKRRFYDHGDRRVYFTDIAQLRERDGQFWYEYWELTGAKMWITNGRMCGIMCLYAKTEEGITGFIVDRHAEGLIVGKDEAKLGQNGSPTNELSLQAVRVPRENVIGLEGRGQVNALETLNVGRAGLPMAASAQMQGLIEQSRAFAQAAYGDIPDWVAWRLQRMEEERFTSEALAYEVIGRFEHPQTKSVRMESAVSKMLVTEALHRIIELAEEIHGLAGQAQLHLVEKRKRDARVLNIYEGTNEVQRFFLLKDLAAAAGGPKGGEAKKMQHSGREALEVETLRGGVRQRLANAVAVFGQELWQNPNLQANCFLLSEATAWLKAADSSLARLAWLSRQEIAQESQTDGGQAGLELGRRALLRCVYEVRDRLRRFDEELTHLRRGYYAPEVRAARLSFQQVEKLRSSPPSSHITRPLTVLVVLEPTVAELPQPRVQAGQLLEAHWDLSEADRAALEVALRLRDQAEAAVTFHVAAVGPRGATPVLRQALSLGAERARLIVLETGPVTADSAALALAQVYRSGPKFDLVLGGCAAAGSEEGVTAQLTAEYLGVPFTGAAAAVAVQSSEAESQALLLAADGRSRLRSLPVAAAIEAGIPLRPFTIAGYLAALTKVVEIERWPRKVPARSVSFVEGTRSTETSVEGPSGPLSVGDAANRLLDALGLSGGGLAPTPEYSGEIETAAGLTCSADSVLAVLAAESTGRLGATASGVLRAARLLADTDGRDIAVLLLTPPDEATQRHTVAHLRALIHGGVVLLVAAEAEGTPEVRGRLLQECWPTEGPQPRVVVGEPWMEVACAALSSRGCTAAIVAERVRRLVFEGDQVVLETDRSRGKVRVRQALGTGLETACWLTLAAEAEVIDNRSGMMSRLKPFSSGALVEGRVWRWTPRLDRFHGRAEIQRLLEEVKSAAGVVHLSEAEFIIDVGFGVGNRDGYEAVIEPLERALRDLEVRDVVIGGSRKVTEELHLLPADRQIGQSGVSVNPRVLLAVGVSGAPQHLSYIGPRAVILAFNRDPEAPIMTLNRRQPRPRVFPIVGDLFETVPALIAALRREQPTVPIDTAEKTAQT